MGSNENQLPPVPSFKGGRIDTPAAFGARSRLPPRVCLSSPQRLKVQASLERVTGLQDRLRVANAQKDKLMGDVEAIMSNVSGVDAAEGERVLIDAMGVNSLIARAEYWTCLSTLAKRQNKDEQAVYYLDQAIARKAQPIRAIQDALQALFLAIGGKLDELLTPPDLSEMDSMATTPTAGTPITQRLQASIQLPKETDVVAPCAWGTPRAEKLQMLRQVQVPRYQEKDTPSPTPTRITQLTTLLKKAYIQESPATPTEPTTVRRLDMMASPALSDRDLLQPPTLDDPDDFVDVSLPPEIGANADSHGALIDDDDLQYSFDGQADVSDYSIEGDNDSLNVSFEQPAARPFGGAMRVPTAAPARQHPQPKEQSTELQPGSLKGTTILLDKVRGADRMDVASPVRRTYRRVDHEQTTEEAQAILAEVDYQFVPNDHLTPIRPSVKQQRSLDFDDHFDADGMLDSTPARPDTRTANNEQQVTASGGPRRSRRLSMKTPQ